MLDKKFGAAGNRMVIEEFMTGREVSVLSFVDGKTIRIMTSAQDHKRAKDGDQGLNTGGMGTFSPSPFYTEEVDAFCKKYIYQATVDAMAAEGRPFKGVIFFGLMLTKNGPKVLEYNARFGDLIDFMLYCFYNQIYKAEHLGTSKKTAKISALGIWAIEHILRGSAVKAFEQSKHFDAPTSIYKIVSYAEPIVSIGNQTGEGWFLTGEMVELIKEGVPNIVCTQPFGCLPNHVVGKGVIKALRKAYPSSNIVAIDYDPGASEVNQLNRIKLMLSTAQKNLKKGEGVE
mgnify:CR=1 FL=1